MRSYRLALLVLVSITGVAQSTTTTYTYDAGDHVTSVTDPRGLVTRYTYDGLGQLWQQSSPDTGVTGYSYDANGRRSSMTRANGVSTTYAYDAIGRTTALSAGGQTQRFTYDICANGLGRLCIASDATGSVGYSYTPEGWVNGRSFTVGTTSYAVGYSYNAVGQVTALVYPDGNQALYSYTNGVVSGVNLKVGGNVVAGASQVTYQPQNRGMTSWVGSNNALTTLYYDTDGRHIGTNVDHVQSFGMHYDNADRIVQRFDGLLPDLSQSFGYDDQSRLVSVQGNVVNEAYQYDANGNRIAQNVNGASLNISYESTSNHMLSASGTTFGYDAMGNTTIANGNSRWQYDPFNRMVAVAGGAYYVDAEGQRLMKTPAGGTATYFVPERDNRMLAENNGGVWVDYLWLNGRLVGRITGGQVQVVHVDQTGRPEVVTDANQAVVWRSQNSPFTRKVTVSNGVTLNIGFPGQYYDVELATWNNGYRDYFEWVGRYLQSDPTGLAGGINTYAYVAATPLSNVDPFGLDVTWSGTVESVGAVAGVGGSAFRFDLTSSCVRGVMAHVIVDARGPSFGLGIKGLPPFGFSRSTITLTDRMDHVDPSILEGWFAIHNVGFAGGILGYSVSMVQLGGNGRGLQPPAKSGAWAGLSHGFETGFDAGYTGTAGSSNITEQSMSSCGCGR